MRQRLLVISPVWTSKYGVPELEDKAVTCIIFAANSWSQLPGIFLGEFMAVAFTNLTWWLWSGKHQEPRISNGSSMNPSSDSSMWETDALKFPLVKGSNMAPSSRRVKRKWHSREERKIDREYDVVLVPSDGGCVSGSESDDSDWSIGWFERHGPGFQSDDDADDSFAVLVPCYGRGYDHLVEDSKNNIFSTVGNIPDSYLDGKSFFFMYFLFNCLQEF